MTQARHAEPDRELAVAYLEGKADESPLMAHARRLRDEGRGRVVTYSRKVFIPLTTLCRDRCTYCTFAKPPGAGGAFMEPDEVLAVARAGERHGCTEALFTLGDRPEARGPVARAFQIHKAHPADIEAVVQEEPIEIVDRLA